MKRVLLAKEWTSMRPFAWLLAALALLRVVDLVCVSLPALHRESMLFGAGYWTSDASLTFLLAFAMGTGLLMREIDEGTLAFLDGLPLRRGSVLSSKLAVAGACLLAFALAPPLVGWTLHGLLRHSVDEPIRASALVALALRHGVLVAAGLGFGLVCGTVRHLSWALLVLAVAGLQLLRRSWPAAATWIDPVSLVADGWSTQASGADGLWTVATLALACLAGAWLLFAYAGGVGMLRLAGLAQHRVFRFVMVCIGLAALVGIGVMENRDQKDAGTAASHRRSPRAVSGPRSAARKLVTAHYTFNVPAGFEVDDRELQEADSAFETARKNLSLTIAGTDRIDVDLGGSIEHTSGLASGNRIRVDMQPGWQNVLVHETVHVFASWLVGPLQAQELGRLALFNEGLARWAEPERRASAGRRELDRMAAAVVFRRGLLRQEDLLDPGTLERNLDWHLKYPLGARLIEALVARYGEKAPAFVLLAINRNDFPPNLSGYRLYRTAFQMAGYDLDLVLNDFALALREAGRDAAAFLDTLPRPRGVLVRDGDRVGVLLRLDDPPARKARLVLRLRARPDSPLDEDVVVRRLDRTDRGPVAWVPQEKITRGQICFQGGVNAGFAVVYEPWSCLPLRAAVPAPPTTPPRMP